MSRVPLLPSATVPVLPATGNPQAASAFALPFVAAVFSISVIIYAVSGVTARLSLTGAR